MASVHNEISKKVAEKINAIEDYQEMDQKREAIITKLIEDYQLGKTIDLIHLNQWTNKMNNFAVNHQLPTRDMVTNEMFAEYMKEFKHE